jgi:hypothetical protein
MLGQAAYENNAKFQMLSVELVPISPRLDAVSCRVLNPAKGYTDWDRPDGGGHGNRVTGDSYTGSK